MLEAHAREVHRDLRAADAVMAYDDRLAIGIQLGQARWNITHRNVARTGKRGKRNFERFAHVKDEDALASIETSLERRRFDCANIRHHATRKRAALLFDVVRKQFDLREHRQLGARNRKSERVGLTRQDRFEMRLLVQNFLNVLVVSQARRLVVVEALAVEDFAVLVLEREWQKKVVY